MTVFQKLFFALILSICITFAHPANSSALSPFCYVFSADLQQNSASNDVLALRQALIDQGLLKAMTASNPSFDSTLTKAVIAFQEKYAAEILKPTKLTKGTGKVGAATRKKLNALYVCKKETPTPSPTPAPSPSPTPERLPQNMPRVGGAKMGQISTLKKNDFKEPTMVTFTFTFSIVNDNDDPLYISKNHMLALGWTSNLDSAGGFIAHISSPQTVSIVLPNSYYVAPRSSRIFEAIAVLNNTNNPGGPIGAYINIPRILYSTSTPAIVQPSEGKSIYTGNINSGIIRLGS